MSKVEYYSAEGFRPDGRRAQDLRRFTCSVGGAQFHADGAATVRLGLTNVAAYVFGPLDARGKSRGGGQEAGSVECVVVWAPFSGPQRKVRRRLDRATTDLAASLKGVFEAAILLHLYPGSLFRIVVQVLEADGAVLSCAINAASAALVEAGVAMADTVVSCSAGVVEEESFVDLNQTESNAAASHLVVALFVNTNKISCVLLDSKTSIANFNQMLEVCVAGCKVIYRDLAKTIRRSFAELGGRRNMGGGV